MRLVPMGDEIVDRASGALETVTAPADPVRMVPEPVFPVEPAPTAAPAETYVVQQGDKLFTIAEKKYGDGNKYTLILQANPGLKPDSLRVGQKLVIPARAAPTPAATEAAPADSGDGRSYTVQSGDTLEKIAKRVYSSARPAIMRQLLEANSALGNGGDLLHVGMKLVLPKIDTNPAAPRVESADSSPAAAEGRKTYKVVANDSLWKIAAKFKGTKNVTDMMDAIVAANGDKLHAKGDALQVGWTIVIPD
jgi:nucleoid-associated protein YgaU